MNELHIEEKPVEEFKDEHKEIYFYKVLAAALHEIPPYVETH